jgi:hypothetical protein
MRRVEVDHTDAETGYAYASYLKVTVDDSQSSSHILDASFKYPVVKIIANSGTPDDRSGIQESLLAISDQVTQQLANSTGEWLGKWLVDDSQRDNVRNMKSVLERCR